MYTNAIIREKFEVLQAKEQEQLAENYFCLGPHFVSSVQ